MDYGFERSVLLFHDILCRLVLAQTNEFRMAQMVIGGPLKKFELADEHWLQPHALGHLRLREPLAPSPTPYLWKIGERVLVNLEAFELREQLRSRYGREAIARSRA